MCVLGESVCVGGRVCVCWVKVYVCVCVCQGKGMCVLGESVCVRGRVCVYWVRVCVLGEGYVLLDEGVSVGEVYVCAG